MSSKLNHLSQEQIDELIERYYANEKIADLIKSFNISIQPSQLVKEFPPRVDDKQCVYCNINFVSHYQSRTYGDSLSQPKCPNCGHSDSGACHCLNCRKYAVLIKQQKLENKREYLAAHFRNQEVPSVEFSDLSFEEQVYLGAFLRAGMSEDFNYINSIDSFFAPLAPTDDMQKEVLTLLSKNKACIVISPDSDAECFPYLEVGGDDFSYYQHKVKWKLNVTHEGLTKVPLVEKIINPLEEYNSSELLAMWKKIALQECFDYLLYEIKNILGVDQPIGEKTNAVFSDILNHFSVSEIYGIVYKSTTNALRFKVEQGTYAKHAANSIVGSAHSYADKAVAGSWVLPKFSRKHVQQSAISKFFFERILKVGSDGFYKKPEILE